MNNEIKELINSDNIVITIHNYKGQNIIYSMPEDGIINLYKTTMVTGKNAGKVTNIEIGVACSDGIDIIEEGLS